MCHPSNKSFNLISKGLKYDILQDCTINISSKVSGSVKQEQMDYTDFLNKNANSFDHDNKIMHTEIKDIMCVLKQGSARFVNCTFNFNFPR